MKSIIERDVTFENNSDVEVKVIYELCARSSTVFTVSCYCLSYIRIFVRNYWYGSRRVPILLNIEQIIIFQVDLFYKTEWDS